jgi:hypothetical protein
MGLSSGYVEKRCGPFHSNDLEDSKFPWGKWSRNPKYLEEVKKILRYPTLVCCDLHKVEVLGRGLKKTHNLPRFIHL